MTTPMPTIFDVTIQPEEMDYPECPICGDPIDYCLGHADDEGDDDIDENTCRECGIYIGRYSLSANCANCDNELYFEAAYEN